ALDTLKTLDGEVYQNLLKRIDFQEEERSVWEEIIEKMYFPYDEKRKIYPLDDGFLIRKVWDESKIPVEKRHLLYENYHPLFIFRQRMSKQADAILGMYLHSNLFTKEELQRNYDFYQEVTLHHSSLSTCIFGILACQIGYEEESYHYFAQSARMDLDDYHHNFYAGIHAANMAGTWQAIVNGFAGLRMNRGYLEFWPTLPKAWDGYEFRLNYKGNLLKIQVDRQEIQVILLEGQEASFWLCGKQWILKKEGDYAKEKR
ncbi:MAG: glycosyl hydrolase family 65 protein, partial [Hungatella sp.]